MANRTKLTKKKREKFLEYIAEIPNVTRAARLIGMSRRRMYEVKDAEQEFSDAWDDAVEQGLDRVEEELYRRAVEGVDKPVTYQGEITDTYTEYSDTLLMFYLNGRRSEVFKNKHEVSGPGGAPLAINVTINRE